MPVSIACPKCQSKYTLPDNLKGKPVKCKSCGATFRAQSAQSPTKPTAGAVPNVVSSKDIAKYGIEGQLKRAPEIFSTPPNQSPSPNALGNFALEDPGFADIEAIKAKAEAKKNRKRKAREPIDFSEYSTARLGMQLIFYAGCVLISIGIGGFFFGLFGIVVAIMAVSGGSGGEFVGNVGGFVATVFFILAISLVPLAYIAGIVGQILCISAPKKSERVAAGLVFGAVFAAVAVSVTGAFVTGFLNFAAETTAGEGSTVAVGTQIVAMFIQFGFVVGAWVLSLSSMYFFIRFYQKVGKNIRSQDLVSTAKLAIIVWLTTLVFSVIGSVGMGVMIGIATEETREALWKVAMIVALINAGLGLATICAILSMVRTGIKATVNNA